MEAARATTRFGSVGYFTLTMWSCIALIHELRGERAAADRLVAGIVPELPGTATIRRIPWLARVSAHRGSDEALERIEESTSMVGRDMAKGAILEALCDVIAELGRWELADDAVAEARAFAEIALLDALPLHADRLDGCAALARGDLTGAA